MTIKTLRLTVKAALLAAAIIAPASCAKSELDTMAGSYTYKTSGTVTLIPTQIAEMSQEQLEAYKAIGGIIDTLVRTLTPEQGQMNITVTDNDSNRVLVSWNDLLGNVSTAYATVSGNRLSLEPSTKTPTLSTIGRGLVTFSGEGELYSNILMLEMQYSGTFSIQDLQTAASLTVIDSDVQCVAKAN